MGVVLGCDDSLLRVLEVLYCTCLTEQNTSYRSCPLDAHNYIHCTHIFNLQAEVELQFLFVSEIVQLFFTRLTIHYNHFLFFTFILVRKYPTFGWLGSHLLLFMIHNDWHILF